MKNIRFKRVLSLIMALLLFAEPVVSYAETGGSTGYSDRWVIDENGWHVKNANGVFIKGAWVNDLTSGGTENQWYLIDENGRMIDSQFILTPEGDLYALHMEHDGHFGMMMTDDFILDGRRITVNKEHDGTFGRILLPEDISYITGKYPVAAVTVPAGSTVTLGVKRVPSYSGRGSYTSAAKKEDPIVTETGDGIPDPRTEMGFEEASQKFTVFVKAESGKGSISRIKSLLKITDVSRLDGATKDHTEIPFDLEEYEDGIYLVWPDYDDGFGDRVHIFEAGHTYIAEVPEDCDYVLGATAFPEMDDEIIWAEGGIKRINFNVQADEVFDAELDPSVMFIPFSEDMDITGEAFGSVITAYLEEDGSISADTAESVTGTFTYSDAVLEAGDTVAIYKGERPFGDGDESVFATADTDQLAYLTVTEADGDKYTYRTAEMEEVLFIPDMILVEKNQVISGGAPEASSSDYAPKASPSDAAYADMTSGEITVSKSLLKGGTFVPGDFVAIYDKDGTEDDVIYGLLTAPPEITGNRAVIYYDIISYGEMKDMYSMHYTVPVDVDLSDEEKREKEREITEALMDNNSAFIDGLISAGIEDYISSEEFAELSGEPLLMASPQGALPGAGDKSRIKIVEYPVPSVMIHKDQSLAAFDNKYKGLIISIKLVFEAVIDEKFDIWFELEYEQQYAIDYNIDGSVTCEKMFLGIPNPATLDANVAVSIDTHNFYHFHLQIRGGTAENSWFDETRLSKEEQDFIKEFDRASGMIKEFAKPFGLEYVKDCITDDLGEPGEMALSQMAHAYAAFMGRSNMKDWYMLPPVELFQVSHRVLYQLVQIRLRGDLCAQVKLCAQAYIEYDSKSAERVTYTVTCRKQLSRVKEVTQLIPPESATGIYVFGHAGFRFGIKITAEVGLIHVKVAKAAIIVEAGLYAELMGVFAYYYHTIGNDSEHVAFGFMNFETGLYAVITALAQALNMRQLTVSKQLADKKMPFFTIGIETICFEFEMAGQEPPVLKLKGGEYADIPAKYLKVKELALNTGIISVKDPAQTLECSKIRVNTVDPFYVQHYVYKDKITLKSYLSDKGDSGNIILCYDNGYTFLDGVLGTIPPFTLTVPAEITE